MFLNIRSYECGGHNSCIGLGFTRNAVFLKLDASIHLFILVYKHLCSFIANEWTRHHVLEALRLVLKYIM